MLQTEIEFTKNTLYVFMKGIANKKSICELQRKMYHIIDEYDITDIVIDIKHMKSMDFDTFYQFLDDYDIKYGGNLNVVE